jgi:hypothetical protein
VSTAAHARLLSEALLSFEAACGAAGGAREHRFDIAGLPVRVLLAGEGLEPKLLPSLAHLAAPPSAEHGRLGGPSLTICAWDGATTGTPFPSLPLNGGMPGSPRGVPYFERDGLRALFNPNSGSLSLLDAAGGVAVYWVAAADGVPPQESAAPFRTILQWWLADHGSVLAHAAAAGKAGRGALIAGGERAGKSTTAWLCLRHGLEIAGDDHVALTREPPDRVFSLYSSLKLDPGWPPGDPGPARESGGPAPLAGGKVVSYLVPGFEPLLARSLALVAILLPHIGGGAATTIRPASPAEAIRTLAPTTIYIQAGAREDAFRALTGIVRRVPSHVLELGRDLGAIAGTIERFLEAC